MKRWGPGCQATAKHLRVAQPGGETELGVWLPICSPCAPLQSTARPCRALPCVVLLALSCILLGLTAAPGFITGVNAGCSYPIGASLVPVSLSWNMHPQAEITPGLLVVEDVRFFCGSLLHLVVGRDDLRACDHLRT